MVSGVVLAAGRSSRMGRPKALLPVDGRDTFVTRLVGTLRAAGLGEVVVVVPADGPVEAIREALAALRPTPRVAVNPDPSRGQLSSLLTGLEAVDRSGVDAMLMTLVDVPRVTPETVRALLAAYASTRAPVVRPVRAADGAHGHPVIFDRGLFDELRRASFASGAKPVVHAHRAAIVDVPVDDDGAFVDVDTPVDYRRVFGRPVPGLDG